VAAGVKGTMSFSDTLWHLKAKAYRRLRPKFILNAENKAIQNVLQHIEGQSIKRVLDMGCGVGNSARLLDKKPGFLVAMDRSISMLKQSRLCTLLINADMLHPPFRDEIFDLILCVGVTEYIADINGLLQRITKLLVPQGYLIITISPPGPLTYLRFLLGQRIFPLSDKKMINRLHRRALTIVKKSNTLLQVQYLLQKK
jgi:predicted TPR repeat methyltransferase